MPLIQLVTDLKSLKYGKDTPGGGYSGQPYIQAKIPDGLEPKSADFILRGGYLTPLSAAEDIKRLAKMFGDLKSPNGLLFIAKQNVLSNSAVRTQTSGVMNEGIYTPLSTLAQAGVVAFGGHLNKQGINPFEQTGAYALDNDSLYSVKVKSSQPIEENRLVSLYTAVSSSTSTKLSGFTLNGNGGSTPVNVLSYGGGPGAPLGVGNTNIRFADQRTGLNNKLAKLPGADKNYFFGTRGTNQFSVDQENKQVGGLQVDTGNGTKGWIKGGVYFDGNAKNVYFVDNDNFLNGLPSNNVNTPQSASLSNIPDGPKTWTPDQSLKLDTGNGTKPWIKGGVYFDGNAKNVYFVDNDNFLNGLPSNNVNTPQSASLSNIPTGSVTWTPKQNNPDSLKYTKTLSLIGDQSKNIGVSGKYFKLTDVSINNNFNFFGKQIDTYNFNVYDPNTTPGNTWPKNSPLIYVNNTFTYNQEDIIKSNVNPIDIKSNHLSPKIQDFRKVLRASLGETTKNAQQAKNLGATPDAPSYQDKNLAVRVNIGDPGQRANKSYASYSTGVVDESNPNKSIYGNFSNGTPKGLDQINALPIYRSENVAQNSQEYPVNDLVKFRIAAIDNNDPSFKTFIHFRAFIDSFSDSYNASWGSVRYLGRGENFYNYNGFDRTISLSFTVAAQSKQELIPMYKKLNYLASQLTPDYSPFGYMRGPLVQLTMGGYLYEQVGFISALTYDIPNDTTWEIGLSDTGGNDSTVKELPHRINVSSFQFTPIHNFVPSKQGLGFAKQSANINQEKAGGFVTEYGPQRYIALSNRENNNYDS